MSAVGETERSSDTQPWSDCPNLRTVVLRLVDIRALGASKITEEPKSSCSCELRLSVFTALEIPAEKNVRFTHLFLFIIFIHL
jgi:hypothetical protein